MDISANRDNKIELLQALKSKHVAIPGEHGAWIFLLSPLVIGLVLGGFSSGSLPLVISLLSAFLIRQPITMLVKIKTGRRTNRDYFPALFWFVVYGLLAVISVIILVLQGFQFVLYLIVPAIPVFLWHLWLVSKRAERRQKFIEVAAGGVLALASPAAFWVGKGNYDPFGWTLWALSWLQVAGTILYAYLRLQQRQLQATPDISTSFSFSKEPLVFNVSLFFIVIILAWVGWVPPLTPLAFLIQPIEVLWGITHPAIKVPPKKIGIRQLIISILFTVVFIITWIIN